MHSESPQRRLYTAFVGRGHGLCDEIVLGQIVRIVKAKYHINVALRDAADLLKLSDDVAELCYLVFCGAPSSLSLSPSVSAQLVALELKAKS